MRLRVVGLLLLTPTQRSPAAEAKIKLFKCLYTPLAPPNYFFAFGLDKPNAGFASYINR